MSCSTFSSDDHLGAHKIHARLIARPVNIENKIKSCTDGNPLLAGGHAYVTVIIDAGPKTPNMPPCRLEIGGGYMNAVVLRSELRYRCVKS